MELYQIFTHNRGVANANQKQKKVEISESAMELAVLMKKDPEIFDQSLIQDGAELLGLFSDGNYTTRRFKDLSQLKISCLLNAIEDISKGVNVLRTSTLGLSFGGKSIGHYVSPHGTLPSGDVVFSVNWKNIVAFKNWRFDQGAEIPQEVINTAIYFLTYEISQLLP